MLKGFTIQRRGCPKSNRDSPCGGYFAHRSNFRQMAMHGENSLKIIAKPDGQAK